MTHFANQPLVTVAIPCYNHEKYVRDCIYSVLNQDYRNIELIIIDDGSSDGSINIIKDLIQLCNNRFTRFEFRYRSNFGVSATLNEALTWAKGKYFSTLASDDLLLENKISTLVDSFENLDDSYAATFGDVNFIDSVGSILTLDLNISIHAKSARESKTNSFFEYYAYNKKIDYKNSNVFGSYISLLRGNYLPAMGCILRTDYVRLVNGFTINIAIEDWDLWLKLSKSYRFHRVPVAVSLYRLHGNNSIIINSEKLLLDSLKMLKNEESYAVKNGLQSLLLQRKITSILGLICKRPYYIFVFYKEFLNLRTWISMVRIIIIKLL